MENKHTQQPRRQYLVKYATAEGYMELRIKSRCEWPLNIANRLARRLNERTGYITYVV